MRHTVVSDRDSIKIECGTCYVSDARSNRLPQEETSISPSLSALASNMACVRPWSDKLVWTSFLEGQPIISFASAEMGPSDFPPYPFLPAPTTLSLTSPLMHADYIVSLRLPHYSFVITTTCPNVKSKKVALAGMHCRGRPCR